MSTPLKPKSAGFLARNLTLHLYTPVGDDRPVYLSGNFNQWQTADADYQLLQVGPGHYRYTFRQLSRFPKILEYKYHRAPDWTSVETDLSGGVPDNRLLVCQVGRQEDTVPNWQKEGLYYRKELLPDIRIISEDFEMPQLIRTRRVAALLPHNYEESNRRYPVLYLQDGQNLFDDYAPFGNWSLDQKLALLAARGRGDVIIIAIDHAADQRAAEYTPSFSTRLGSGDGENYAGWLTETLKPYVDRSFRTLPEREHTGIGGSSMGGLISIYAALLYPDVFGKLMIFSPSLWVSPNISLRSGDPNTPFRGRVYLYGGGKESEGLVGLLYKFRDALLDKAKLDELDIKLRIEAEGNHSEAYWGNEFPYALEWLYYPSASS